MAKGFGIPKRRAVMNSLEGSDPARYEELMWLRRHRPNAYRRAVNALIAELDELPDLGEYEPLEIREGGPMATARVVMPWERAAAGEASAPASRTSGAQAMADFSILELTLTGLRAELATGDHDLHLSELLEAEAAGRKRKGAMKAIQAQIAAAG